MINTLKNKQEAGIKIVIVIEKSDSCDMGMVGTAGADAKGRIRNESCGRLLRTLLYYRPSSSGVRKSEFSGKRRCRR